jgi:gamma-glutamylcyclotransferase (GGCT)/AIG2-like uncharacterized protein YtfP
VLSLTPTAFFAFLLELKKVITTMLMSPTSSIFVYGTLCSPEVLRVLLGRVPTLLSPAFLNGYQRYPVIGQVFPGMVPSLNAESQTQGVLLLNLSSNELCILDYFEGDEYTRQCVTVSCQGDMQETQTYVWSNPVSELDLGKAWDYHQFCNEKLKWYIATTVRPCRREMDELGIGNEAE